MAYDSAITVFSPDGHLFQVEYAMEAVRKGTLAVAVRGTDVVVIGVEKKMVAKLQDPRTMRKIQMIDDHVAVAFAGLTADANILINAARVAAGRYKYQYGEPMPVEQLVSKVCDHKQLYTQYGGQRPFGVKFLFAGYDVHHGYQLYLSDPSGNYSGWKATCMGQNANSGQGLLKAEYEESMDRTSASNWPSRS